MIISAVDLGHNNPRGRRARMAREHFASNGPPDAQPLPLGYAERERMKIGGLSTIVALYARSLALRREGASIILRLRLRFDGIGVHWWLLPNAKERGFEKSLPPAGASGARAWPMLATAQRARTHDGELPTQSGSCCLLHG
jgi:hypothetical protein